MLLQERFVVHCYDQHTEQDFRIILGEGALKRISQKLEIDISRCIKILDARFQCNSITFPSSRIETSHANKDHKIQEVQIMF